MPHATRKKTQLPFIVAFLLQRILPRVIRAQYFEALQQRCLAGGNWPGQSIHTIRSAYKTQIILATDKLSIAAHIVGMAYCFWMAGMPVPLAIVLGSVLVPLILRTAYTHLWDRYGNRWTPTSPWQYSKDSMFDAVITIAVVLMCQTITMMVAPEDAMKPQYLFRGITLGLPALAAMRMIMRPRADWEHMPFKNSGLTALQIYTWTWVMNACWIATCVAVVMANANSLPDWIPDHAFFKVFLPLQMFINWIRVQQNALIRRDHIETALGPHWKKKELARKREVLMKGLAKGEPFYAWYIGLQAILFLFLSMPLARALWPWLAGTASSRDVYDVLFDVVALIALAWSWSYLKEANRAASDAMQQEIDSM